MKRFGLIFLFFLLIPSVSGASEEISYSRGLDLIEKKKVKDAYLTGVNRADLDLKNSSVYLYYPKGSSFSEKLDQAGAEVWFSKKKEPTTQAPPWMSYAPGLSFIYEFWAGVIDGKNRGIAVLLIALFVGSIVFIFFIFPKRKEEKAKTKSMVYEAPLSPTGGRASFSDVSGIDEVVEEVSECADFLKNPEPFARLGAKMPSGVILYGPPGSGKTLLARSVAGEAGVAFFSVSGASFAEKYVGVGPKKVRNLFKNARAQETGAVVFIDEIDALAAKRSESELSDSASHEREATLNELLVEMDGFSENENILIIGATNRVDRLDPAILRPGRFSRKIEVPLPSKQGRLAILRMYSEKKPLAEDVDLENLANITANLSGADLADLVNEAAILAARKEAKDITAADFEEAYLKKSAGLEKKESSISKEERETIAYHEAGHVIASEVLPDHPKTNKVSIKPRNGGAGGLAFYGQKDQALFYGDDIHQRLIVLLAGRAAEEVRFEKVSSGAASDLSQAEKIARQAIVQFGFSKKGQVAHKEEALDLEVKLAVERAYSQAIFILKNHKKELDQLARILLEKESVSREDLDCLFQLKEVSLSSLPHLFSPNKKKSLWRLLKAKRQK